MTIGGWTGHSNVTYRIVPPGTYVLTEERPANSQYPPEQFAMYEPGEWTCTTADGTALEVNPQTDEVDLPEGAQVTCAIENTWTGSTISFRKQVINSSFGSHGPGEWELAVDPADGGPPIAAGNGADGIVDVPITPGEYRLSELAGPDGYELMRFQCLGGGDVDPAEGTLTVPPSSVLDCTVTNRAIPPTLTLVKALDNTGGGTAEVADFTLLARGPGNAAIAGPSGSPEVTEVPLPPGEYVFSERGPEGYDASWECTGGRSWDAEAELAVMDAGDDMVCTATNTVVRPTLTLVKEVDGGPAEAADWELAASGPTSITGASGEEAVTAAAVDAGVYELGEAPAEEDDPTAAGYAAGSWRCDAGELDGTTLTLAPGEDVTCTVTNTWEGGTLTLVKEVADGQVEPPGGGNPADWTLTAAGPVTVAGPGGSEGIAEQTVPAGDYQLSESVTEGASVHPDYRPGEWACAGEGFSWEAEGPGEGTLSIEPGAGAEVTCTLTNLFQPPHLTLQKDVVGGGPLSDPADWTLAFDGPVSGEGVTGEAPITGVAVGSGTYLLSEQATEGPWAAGYETAGWECTGGSVEPLPDGGAELTLTAEDRDVVCTVTNAWQGGSLTLAKEVADGGETPDPPGEPGDWTLSAVGPVTVEGPGGSEEIVAQPVLAGDYDLSEVLTGEADGDYRPGEWSCSGEGFSWEGGEPGEGTLSIEPGAGAEVTCTLTNLLRPPHLTLVKSVDGGPLADPADWTLTAAGEEVTLSGPGDDPGLVGRAVGSGTFQLSEEPTDPDAVTAGYTTAGWSCDGGELTPGAAGTAELELSADGDLDVTCEIVNEWTGGTLTLLKEVEDGSEGPGNTPANWTLTAAEDAAGVAVSGPGGSAAVEG